MTKIPQETLEQIATANDIVDVISAYFPLKRTGATFKAICPFHKEKSPSFTVNPQRQIFKCFGCGAGGGVFQFVQLYENLAFPEAVKKLADRAGIRIIEEPLNAEDQQRLGRKRRQLAIHEAATVWFHQNLIKTNSGAPAREYLKRRGFTIATAKFWRLGYAPDSWSAFADWAKTQGFHPSEIEESGLAKPRNESKSGGIYDRFRNRLMFPICNEFGETIAFSGRILSADSKEAKYVNSPETILFKKGDVLFGLDKSKRNLVDQSSAIVCEGQLDVITAFEAGATNVIAAQGTAFTENQARLLKRFVDEVILCFDGDSAGQKAIEKSLPALLGVGLFVRVAGLPGGHDPHSLIRESGSDAFLEAMQKAADFFDFQTSKALHSAEYQTTRGKVQWIRKLAGFLGMVPDPVTRDTILLRIAGRFEINADEFARQLRLHHPKPDPEEETVQTPLTLGNTIRLLCHLALCDPSSRMDLQENPIPSEYLRIEEGEAFFQKILQSPFESSSTEQSETIGFHLDPVESSILSSLRLEKAPSNPSEILKDCRKNLEYRYLKIRQDHLVQKLRSGSLSQIELEQIQKEVLELGKRIYTIASLP